MSDFILPADHERTSILVRRREFPSVVVVEETLEVEPIEFSPPELPPGKEFFRIREVADLLDLDPQKLRDWEDDFSMVRPTKSGGQRVYRRTDVETLAFIRQCVIDDKLPIAETRRRAKEWKKRDRKPVASPALEGIAQDLRELIRFAQSGPF